MTHPLVDQLRFARSEWPRGLDGLTEEEARQHFGKMNCISWDTGHMAWQEHRYWLRRMQGKVLFPQLEVLFAFGAPMSTPAMGEMLETWVTVTAASNEALDSLTQDEMLSDLPLDGKATGQTIGSAMLRMTYHYWYHTGEIQAIRQMLGHADLPQYVGDLEGLAPYRTA
jgi:hypothetical protein